MMNNRISELTPVCLLLALVLTAGAAAQELPTILHVDVQNSVTYVGDVTDLSKLAKSSTPVQAVSASNFSNNVVIADVTAINGSPAKGVMVMQNQGLLLSPTPTAGQAISDVTRSTCVHIRFELLKADGGPIGSIFSIGLSAGTPPPGSPLGVQGGNNAIVGGTGAFMGVTGTVQAMPGATGRLTSQAEDPSMRRINGGGTGQWVLQIIPKFRPEIVATQAGPAVFHTDYSQVTSAKPAQKGETLIVLAKGLGPTKPGVNPGDPFPRAPFAIVTSPVEVLADGKALPTINQLGLPDSSDVNWLDFQVPNDTTGAMMTVQLSAAWVKGAEVRIPIQ